MWYVGQNIGEQAGVKLSATNRPALMLHVWSCAVDDQKQQESL